MMLALLLAAALAAAPPPELRASGPPATASACLPADPAEPGPPAPAPWMPAEVLRATSEATDPAQRETALVGNTGAAWTETTAWYRVTSAGLKRAKGGAARLKVVVRRLAARACASPMEAASEVGTGLEFPGPFPGADGGR